MHVQPHDLDHEFPEFHNLIHELKQKDPRLSLLFEEYERVNNEIVDIEENDKPFQDFEFEDLKKKAAHAEGRYLSCFARAQRVRRGQTAQRS